MKGLSLGETAKCSDQIVKLGWCKSQFQGTEESITRGKEASIVHPLIPSKCRSLQVKGNNLGSLFWWCHVKIKKLGDLEDPTQSIITVEKKEGRT